MTDMTLKDYVYARTAKFKTTPRPKVWKLIRDIFCGLAALDAIDLVYCDGRSENTGLIDSILTREMVTFEQSSSTLVWSHTQTA